MPFSILVIIGCWMPRNFAISACDPKILVLNSLKRLLVSKLTGLGWSFMLFVLHVVVSYLFTAIPFAEYVSGCGLMFVFLISKPMSAFAPNFFDCTTR